MFMLIALIRQDTQSYGHSKFDESKYNENIKNKRSAGYIK